MRLPSAPKIETEPSAPTMPALFISVPHLNENIDTQSAFPGEPTPLLHALAVIEDSIEKNQFPAATIPDIQRILHPQVYTEEFEKNLIQELQTKNPRLVGLSNISEGHANALKIAKIVKTHCPDCILIIGGPHEDDTNFEALKKGLMETRNRLQKTGQKLARSTEQLEILQKYETLANPDSQKYIDFVVSGDGAYLLMHLLTIISNQPEAQISELKKYILENKDNFQTVPGSGYLCFYNPETKEIVRIPISGKPINRNNLPFLHRSRLSAENRYAIFNGKKTAQILIDDGCKYQCTFCHESTDKAMYSLPKILNRTPENVIQELDELRAAGYEAIFFDDSTFTQTYHRQDNRSLRIGDPLYRVSRVEKFLHLLIQKRQQAASQDQSYFEWGCQTTINDLDEYLLNLMAAAGCTYIYVGLEKINPSADQVQKIINLPKNQTWTSQYENIANLCTKTGIRLGTSLQFGIPDLAHRQFHSAPHYLKKLMGDWKDTINFLANLKEKGCLGNQAVSLIALNYNAIYPGTDEFFQAVIQGDIPPKYDTSLQRDSRFETLHDQCEIYRHFPKHAGIIIDTCFRYSKKKLGDSIIGISSAAEWQKYDQKFGRNFYGDKNQDEYFENKRGGIYLNSASITKPFASSYAKAAENFAAEPHLSPTEKEKIFEQARCQAARLINLPDPRGIILCRNTTEAINMAVRLSGATNENEVLITDAENASIDQAVNFHFDHGNPEGRNPWCSYPTWYRKRFSAQPTYPSVSPQLSGITTLEFKIFNQSLTEIYHQIDNYLYEYPNISTVILSHVIRDSGQELPIKQICDHIRNGRTPEIFIIVDGAQSVGNVPQIDFRKLNCDAYAFTPHKTLKSAGVVGILAINPENDLTNNNLPLLKKSDPCKGEIILEGMFHKSLDIKPNVPDSLCTADSIGFSAAIEELENKYGLTNNDFSQISSNRQTLKDYFINGLQKLSASVGIPIVLTSNPAPTGFILNFQILARDMHEIAANLCKQGIFLSYIGHDPNNPERNYLRASFDISQTHDEIDQALTTLAKILQITPQTD